MRRFNYLVSYGPSGTEWEKDLATCGHCNSQMEVQPSKDAKIIVRINAPCPGCTKYICHVCQAEGGACKTWEKRMEESEARAKLLQSILG